MTLKKRSDWTDRYLLLKETQTEDKKRQKRKKVMKKEEKMMDEKENKGATINRG